MNFPRILLCVVALLATLGAGQAQATGQGATIFNQATLTYDGGETKATITVLVALVPAPPIYVSVPNDPGANVSSGSDVSLSYALTARANGADQYSISSASTDSCTTCSGGVTLSAPAAYNYYEGSSGTTPLGTAGAGFTLGSAILAAQTTSNTVQIPAGSESNLAGVSQVAIETSVGVYHSYTVGTITPGSVAALDTPEVPTTVVLTPTVGGPLDGGAPIGDGTGGTIQLGAGTVIGEVITFRAVVTTGTFDGAATDGTHNITFTAESDTDTTLEVADSVTITVVPVSVTIVKEVANVTDPTLGPSCSPAPCFGGTGSVQAKPGHTLRYRIRASVASTEPNATNSKLYDVVPQYTTYIADSLRINGSLHTVAPATDNGVLPLSVAGGLTIQSGGAAAGVIVSGGSAEVTFDVTVD